MLFGATIEVLPNTTFRIKIKRNKKRWNALGFLITVIESQDSLDFLSLKVQTTGGELVVRTRDTQFLGSSYRRWYGTEGVCAVPKDLVMDDLALAFWLTGNWSETRIDLPSPGGLTADQRGRVPWKHAILGNSILVVEAERPKVKEWLNERMPAKFWSSVSEQDKHDRGKKKRS